MFNNYTPSQKTTIWQFAKQAIDQEFPQKYYLYTPNQGYNSQMQPVSLQWLTKQVKPLDQDSMHPITIIDIKIAWNHLATNQYLQSHPTTQLYDFTDNHDINQWITKHFDQYAQLMQQLDHSNILATINPED